MIFKNSHRARETIFIVQGWSIVVIIAALIFAPNVYSQFSDTARPLFNFDALNFYSPDSTHTRLDLYIEVPFNNLEFKRIKTGADDYSADFEVTVDIKDASGALLMDKVYKEELTTKHPETKYLEQRSKIIIKNYFLQPGKYKLLVSFYEPGTKRTSEQERDITIHNFLSDPLTISDVMIVSKIEEQGDRKAITPDVSRNVSAIDTAYLFFFVYRNDESPSITVQCRIMDSEKEQVYETIRKIDNTNGIDTRNQVILPIPVHELIYDKFTAEIKAVSDVYAASITTGFENISKYFPARINNIDERIDELQYIASDKEIDYMRDGKTNREKQKRFLDFWKSKNPNPLSQRNIVMDEYYKRLMYANKHFSTSFTKGWKTDMGMVYIIFGAPSDIERHPYEMDSKPYEIWDYYELNRQFIFVDNSGFGDYRLITPIWETFNYH
jgi:GWxTD domain-containing protein